MGGVVQATRRAIKCPFSVFGLYNGQEAWEAGECDDRLQ